MPEAFTFFWKHRLSQWHRAPFIVGGMTFQYAEQYMMYAKALLFGDREAADRIFAAETPREHQAIGRQVREPPDWLTGRNGRAKAAAPAKPAKRAKWTRKRA